jgi:hypothetical protein
MYIGVNNIARKIKNCYVGVNGTARKVKAVYVGVNGVARLVWKSNPIGKFCYLGVRNNQLCVVVSDGYDSDVNIYPVPNAYINTRSTGQNYAIKKIFDTYYISCLIYSPTYKYDEYVLYKTKDFTTYTIVEEARDTLHNALFMKQAGDYVIYYSAPSGTLISSDKGNTFNYDSKISTSYNYYCSDGNYLYYRAAGSYAYMMRIDLTTNQITTFGSFTEAYDGEVICDCAGNNMALFFTKLGKVFKINAGGGYGISQMSGDTFNSNNYPVDALYFNGLFYIITSANKVYRSSDGINWSILFGAYKDYTYIRNICVVNNILHVLIGVSTTDWDTTDDKTYIYYSIDGTTFEERVVNELLTSVTSI